MLFLAIGAVAPVAAQGQRPDAAPKPERVVITAGRSTVITLEQDARRIAVNNPDIADAVVVQPREILIDGKKPGTISLIVWMDGGRKSYDLVVEPAPTALEQQLQSLFPNDEIRVRVSDEALILTGTVATTAVMLRAAEIARASSPKSQVINMLEVPGATGSQQVMLQVRFGEVSQRALTELGASFFASRDRFSARSTTQQFGAPDFDDQEPGGLVFSDYLNLFFFDRKHGIGGVVKALESTGGFQSLAEPNLIAYNGEEASFLAGGEFPVPIAQGTNDAVSVLFKEFGIRLTFTPTIAGDVIRLKVRPEVSTLDFANGITLSGFRIPALTTRRAETDVELRDGQSFAIAGLLDNVTQYDKSAVPILSKLPIIGSFFKSKADRKERTELMVLITPRLVRPMDAEAVPALPVDTRQFLPKGGAPVPQGSGAGTTTPSAPATSWGTTVAGGGKK